jgi:Mn-containing catalase
MTQSAFGQLLLEQFGGATGEHCRLAILGTVVHVENPGIKDMLQDIAIEEFGHLEMVEN